MISGPDVKRFSGRLGSDKGKFVTARHSLQSIWKIGLAGNEQKELVVKSLADRFIHCVLEKNYTLIRFDIFQGLRNLYDEIKEEK